MKKATVLGIILLTLFLAGCGGQETTNLQLTEDGHSFILPPGYKLVDFSWYYDNVPSFLCRKMKSNEHAESYIIKNASGTTIVVLESEESDKRE